MPFSELIPMDRSPINSEARTMSVTARSNTSETAVRTTSAASEGTVIVLRAVMPSFSFLREISSSCPY